MISGPASPLARISFPRFAGVLSSGGECPLLAGGGGVCAGHVQEIFNVGPRNVAIRPPPFGPNSRSSAAACSLPAWSLQHANATCRLQLAKPAMAKTCNCRHTSKNQVCEHALPLS